MAPFQRQKQNQFVTFICIFPCVNGAYRLKYRLAKLDLLESCQRLFVRKPFEAPTACFRTLLVGDLNLLL